MTLLFRSLLFLSLLGLIVGLRRRGLTPLSVSSTEGMVGLPGVASVEHVEGLDRNMEVDSAEGSGSALSAEGEYGSVFVGQKLKLTAVLNVLDALGHRTKEAGVTGLKFGIALVAMRMALKVVTRWYVDFTTDELLFDSRDHRYRSFGAIFHDHASNTILASSILRDSLEHDSGEAMLLDHVMNCLNVDCFTHTMDEFTTMIQTEVGEIIAAAAAHRQITGQDRSFWANSRGTPHFTTVYFAAVSLLLVRQADAQLRTTRNHLLWAATRLEDHLEYLSSKLVYDNSGGRFVDLWMSSVRYVRRPLMRIASMLGPSQAQSMKVLVKKLPIAGRNGNSVMAAIDNSHHRSRITVLKEWIDRVHMQLAIVQDHLDQLEGIEGKKSTKRLATLPSNILPWSLQAFTLCKQSAGTLRNGNSVAPVVTTVPPITKTVLRKSSCRKLHSHVQELNEEAHVSENLVKQMPYFFRERLDIETRIGDVMSVRHRTRRGFLSTIRFLRARFASAAKVCVAGLALVYGLRIRRHRSLIQERVQLVRSNTAGFMERRIITPSVSILNDVVLNKKVAITDREALLDSKRSLQTMLDDFLAQYKPKMSAEERQKRAAQLDMSDISVEYERELRKPIQNIVSGRIARLALIQMQFVKKELLVAMQAIDDLVNANQVNLQLLAVMPAFMVAYAISSGVRSLLTVARSFSRGSSRLVQTKQMVKRDLKNGFRCLERELCLTDEQSPNQSDGGEPGGAEKSRGRAMCILYRMHRIIMDKSELLSDETLVKQLRQDLADLMTPNLLAERKIVLIKLCQDNL